MLHLPVHPPLHTQKQSKKEKWGQVLAQILTSCLSQMIAAAENKSFEDAVEVKQIHLFFFLGCFYPLSSKKNKLVSICSI